MRFAFTTAFTAAFVTFLSVYSSHSAIRPIEGRELSSARGGQQLVCLINGNATCPGPATSPSCDSIACTAPPPDYVLSCPQSNNAAYTNQGTYPNCTPSATGSDTCTGAVVQCVTAIPCTGSCSPKQGSTSLYCSNGTTTLYPNPVNATTENFDLCPPLP